MVSPKPITPVPTPPPVEHDALPTSSGVDRINKVLEDEAPAASTLTSSASSTGLTRSGTLSWQQRRSRPLSQVALENNTMRHERSRSQSPIKHAIEASTTTSNVVDTRSPSRSSIYSTEHRHTSGSESPKRSSTVLEREPPQETPTWRDSGSASNTGSFSQSNSMSNRQSMSTSLTDGTRNSFRASSVYNENPLAATPTLSPSTTAMGPPAELPSGDSSTGLSRTDSISGRNSPTKGLGGFVQSAMMKRSDSVSKRWSATPTPGLSRSGSVASNSGRAASSLSNSGVGGGARSAYAGQDGSAKLEPSLSATTPTTTTSRPSSIHSNLTITNTEQGQDNYSRPVERAVTPTLHSRSRSVASLQGGNLSGRSSPTKTGADVKSPPTSPSKRWSPTKSSWLESAIGKSEERQKPEAVIGAGIPDQPSWMVDLAKKKAEKADQGGHSRSGSAIGSAVGSAGLFSPERSSTDQFAYRATSPPILRQSMSTPEPAAKPAAMSGLKEPERAVELRKSPPPTVPSPSSKPSLGVGAKHTPSSSTSGPVDFRANLRSKGTTLSQTKSNPTSPPAAKSMDSRAGETSNEPEFRKALGGLKRAQTQNYRAPDLLKDNITKGKAALNTTGGPAKREKKDELKESLIKQREAMKEKAKVESPVTKEKSSGDLPEALAARRALGAKRAVFGSQSPPDVGAKPVLLPGGAGPLKKPEFGANKPMVAKPVVALPEKKVETIKPVSRPTSTTPSAVAVTTEKKKPVTSPAPYAMKQSGPVSSGGIANRLNPALAGLLARGPPASGASSPGGDDESGQISAAPRPSASESVEPPKETEQTSLTHMIKGRARGPKRRAPKAASAPAEESAPKEEVMPILDMASSTSSANASKEILTSTPPVKEESPAPFAKKLESTLAIRNKPAVVPRPLPAKPVDLPTLTTTDTPSKEETSSRDLSPISVSKPKPEAPQKSPVLANKPSPSTARLSGAPSVATRSVSKEIDSMLDSLASPAASQPKLESKPEVKSVVRPVVKPDAKPEVRSYAPKGSEVNFRASSPVKVHTPTRTTFDPLPIATRSPDRSPERSPDKATFPSVRNAASIWGGSGEDKPTPLGRPKSPIKLPTRRDEDQSMTEAGLKLASSPPKTLPKSNKPGGMASFGTAVAGVALKAVAPQDIAKTSPAPTKSPLSPPPGKSFGAKLDTKSPPEVTQKPTFAKSPSLPTKPQPPKPTKSARPTGTRNHSGITIKVPQPNSEAGRLFAEVFDELPTSVPELDIDVQKIFEMDPLSSHEKGTTLKMTIQELTGDGKLQPLQGNHSYVLFEESMYLCVHMFKSSKTGAKPVTEAYLWAGSGVGSAAVEDAQIFARRAARDAGAGTKLTIVNQGREMPSFFQALGGIVITFRGSRSKTTTTGLPDRFMLCGRKHLGHITFDEVDFAASSLCSGFTYLVSPPNSKKLYLWRGAGSSPDELSAARLIAMDALAADSPAEIEEGSEVDAFLEAFPPRANGKKAMVPPSASHWRLKPSVGEKYRARLFRVHERPASSPGGLTKGIAAGGAALKVSTLNFFGWAAGGFVGRAASPSPSSTSALSTISLSANKPKPLNRNPPDFPRINSCKSQTQSL
jgi:hypothetical protein